MSWARPRWVEAILSIAICPLGHMFVLSLQEAAIAFARKAVKNKKAFTSDLRRCIATTSQRYSANFRRAAKPFSMEQPTNAG